MGWGVVDGAVVAHPVPEGEGHPEEALPADEPVTVQPTHPVVVAGLHEPGVPAQLLAATEQRLAQVGVTPAVAQVPLAAGDHLQRPVALLEELDGVGDGPGLAHQLAGIVQTARRCETWACLVVLPGQLGVGGPSRLGGHRFRWFAAQAPVALQDVADRQVELAPPDHVGEVAEGADHGHARALVGLGQAVGVDGDHDAEQRGGDRGPDEVGVALVVGVADEGHAGGPAARVAVVSTRTGSPPPAGRKP